MAVRGNDVVFMFDVDNTLIDNDAIIADLRMHLVKAFGPDCEQRYWEIFEKCRRELGYADYLGALQRYRLEQPHDLQLLGVSLFLLDYPFARHLFPSALDVIAASKKRGRAIILSDGDVVFQPRKVERSGLWAAVDGNVLIYVHKEQMLGDMQRRYPARRYVMVDDKLRLLRLMKAQLGESLTTIFVRQGHYAHDPYIVATEPPADVQIDAIGDLVKVKI